MKLFFSILPTVSIKYSSISSHDAIIFVFGGIQVYPFFRKYLIFKNDSL